MLDMTSEKIKCKLTFGFVARFLQQLPFKLRGRVGRVDRSHCHESRGQGQKPDPQLRSRHDTAVLAWRDAKYLYLSECCL